MTETPEKETPHPAVAGSYDGWKLSEETREQDRVANERADARERWESQRYGWALFAVITLCMAGGFQIINGFVALYRSGTYLVGRSGLAVDVDYTTWGWVHLSLGALAIVAALGLTRGKMWARILGVALSVISAIAYMEFIPAAPALSLVVIALDILIIYAITVHGRDLKDADY